MTIENLLHQLLYGNIDHVPAPYDEIPLSQEERFQLDELRRESGAGGKKAIDLNKLPPIEIKFF